MTRSSRRVPVFFPLVLAAMLAAVPARAGDDQPPYTPTPEFQAILAAFNAAGNPLDTMTKEDVAGLWFTIELGARLTIAPIPVKHVRDVAVPARNHQIPVRIYVPASKPDAPGVRLPLLVYYHGGGWALGSIATYDSVCRELANEVPAMVVSVDYRLAPEHPFPAAVDDCHLALEWVARNATALGGDPRRIVLAGDSAGGNLATVIALAARKEKIPVVYQTLFYPSTNMSSTDYPSHRQYGQGYMLTTKAMDAFRAFYLPNEADCRKPRASPLLASEADLKLMPPTLIMLAGCDPLRDEGQAYADRLRAAGVDVTCLLEKQMIHGALNFYNNALYAQASPLAQKLLHTAAAQIRRALPK